MSETKYAYPYPAQGYYGEPPVMAPPPQYAAAPPPKPSFLDGWYEEYSATNTFTCN
uniref:Cysteine-rich transmembrane CYSTM domain-containing protein n=1 Tax=Vitis vinifera TaxID=29760 RepID=F6HW59_VITVI